MGTMADQLIVATQQAAEDYAKEKATNPKYLFDTQLSSAATGITANAVVDAAMEKAAAAGSAAMEAAAKPANIIKQEVSKVAKNCVDTVKSGIGAGINGGVAGACEMIPADGAALASAAPDLAEASAYIPIEVTELDAPIGPPTELIPGGLGEVGELAPEPGLLDKAGDFVSANAGKFAGGLAMAGLSAGVGVGTSLAVTSMFGDSIAATIAGPMLGGMATFAASGLISSAGSAVAAALTPEAQETVAAAGEEITGSSEAGSAGGAGGLGRLSALT